MTYSADATEELQRLKASSLNDLQADAVKRLNDLKAQHESDFAVLAPGRAVINGRAVVVNGRAVEGVTDGVWAVTLVRDDGLAKRVTCELVICELEI